MIFRDHFLSDLIGFVYSKMDAAAAAEDFLRRIRENCARHSRLPAAMPWCPSFSMAKTPGNITTTTAARSCASSTAASPTDGGMRAVTVSEALRLMPPEPLDHIFPGSWINANFDVWIGAEEDNQAWTQLLRARQTFDAATGVSEDRRRLAFEELLIAEGSDWCWWYGPEHESANREEFDQLYPQPPGQRLPLPEPDPPEELSRPILQHRRAGRRRSRPRAPSRRSSTAKSPPTSSGWAPGSIAWTSAPAPCTARSSW